MKIKVLMIEISGYGGLAHYTYCLCNELSVNPHFDILLLTDSEYELSEYALEFKLIKRRLLKVSYIHAIKEILMVINQERPDIIHIQSLITARKDFFLFLLARLTKTRIVYTAHNILPHDEEERNAFGMNIVFKIIYKCSNILITHSRYNREELIQIFGLNKNKVYIIPHGNYLFQIKDIQRYTKEEARKILRLHPDDIVVLYFGAVREYKGIMNLLSAFYNVSHTYEKARLIIAGYAKPPMRKKVKSFITDNQLDNKIFFFNYYINNKELGLFFDACDVAALPYHHSYGSGALHTAMAFSKPVIISDLPLFKEVVEEGINGFFFKQEDNTSLLEALLHFFTLSKEKKRMMAESSLSIAQTKYDWKHIAQMTIDLYTNDYQ